MHLGLEVTYIVRPNLEYPFCQEKEFNEEQVRLLMNWKLYIVCAQIGMFSLCR
jgi:hypothetical protein